MAEAQLPRTTLLKLSGISRFASLKRSVIVVPITREQKSGGVMTYLRCTIGRWNTDLRSDEGQEAFRLISDKDFGPLGASPGSSVIG
jgi:hypothetical protein